MLQRGKIKRSIRRDLGTGGGGNRRLEAVRGVSHGEMLPARDPFVEDGLGVMEPHGVGAVDSPQTVLSGGRKDIFTS